MNYHQVSIWTDGAVKPNPGFGGYAALLVYGEHQREISGGEVHTTNQRMELMAARRAGNAHAPVRSDVVHRLQVPETRHHRVGEALEVERVDDER